MIISLHIRGNIVRCWTVADVREGTSELETKLAQKIIDKMIEKCEKEYMQQCPGILSRNQYYFSYTMESKLNYEPFFTEYDFKQFNKMLGALKKIHKDYQTPTQLRRNSEKEYGLGFEESIEMSYENLQSEAANGYKGVKELK